MLESQPLFDKGEEEIFEPNDAGFHLANKSFTTFGSSKRLFMDCEAPRTIHTIGHSTRTVDIFVELLQNHHIELVVDVRRWPASRRLPHFNRAALAESLKESGIDYMWRGDLGGFRKPSADSVNTAWRVTTFRAYADFMLTPEFAGIMEGMEPIAASRRSALMCAEAVPWQCHRQLLADAFLVRHWSVRHIMDNGCHEHKLPPFAQPEGTKIYYRGLLRTTPIDPAPDTRDERHLHPAYGGSIVSNKRRAPW